MTKRRGGFQCDDRFGGKVSPALSCDDAHRGVRAARPIRRVHAENEGMILRVAFSAAEYRHLTVFAEREHCLGINGPPAGHAFAQDSLTQDRLRAVPRHLS